MYEVETGFDKESIIHHLSETNFFKISVSSIMTMPPFCIPKFLKRVAQILKIGLQIKTFMPENNYESEGYFHREMSAKERISRKNLRLIILYLKGTKPKQNHGKVYIAENQTFRIIPQIC